MDEFLAGIHNDFEHMILTEYADESLIVMRRKLCWEISDIFYLPLNARNYAYKSSSVDRNSSDILRNWSSVDFRLYQMYNTSLWRQVSEYGQDFWDELDFYQTQKIRMFDFCQPVINMVKEDPNKVTKLLDSDESLKIHESPWGHEYKIDYVWCLMTKIHTLALRQMIRVKDYPELCKNITNVSSSLYDFKFPKTNLVSP